MRHMASPDGVQKTQRPHSIHISRVLGHLKGHLRLGREGRVREVNISVNASCLTVTVLSTQINSGQGFGTREGLKHTYELRSKQGCQKLSAVNIHIILKKMIVYIARDDTVEADVVKGTANEP